MSSKPSPVFFALYFRVMFGYILMSFMIQTLNEPISIQLVYDHKKRRVMPVAIIWQGQAEKVKKIGLHYMYRTGDTLYHVFTVNTDKLAFKLQLNTSNLFWTLEEISDGLPD